MSLGLPFYEVYLQLGNINDLTDIYAYCSVIENSIGEREKSSTTSYSYDI